MKNKKQLLLFILMTVIVTLTAFMLVACVGPTDNKGPGNGDDDPINPQDNTFSVSFETNGGSAVASQTYVKRSQVSIPVTPTRAGYTFDKWYSNEELTFEWTFESSWVSADTVLYAGWIVNSYYIRYNYQGATENITELTAYVQYDADYNLVVPMRTGYVFGGWYSAANGGGVKYTGDDGVSLAKWTIANSVNVYANWIPLSYNLNLNFVGGSFAGQGTGVFPVRYGQKFEINIIPTKLENDITYNFDGWYTAPEGRGKQVTYNTGESLEIWSIPQDTTLYAKWKRTGSELALITSSPEEMSVVGAKINVVIPNASTEYLFSSATLGLSAGARFSLFYDLDLTEEFGTKTVNGADYGFRLQEITLGNTNFYLLVIAEDCDHRTVYQVTLKRNRMYQVAMIPGNGLETQEFSVEESHLISIPSEFAELTRTGYTFKNWTNTVNNYEWDFSKGISSSLTLVGNWDANSYKVSFDTNSPLITAPATKNILFDQDFSSVLPSEPSLIGYVFDGWYDSIDMLGAKVTSNTVFNTANNIILYAKWLPVFIYENYLDGIMITGVGISSASLSLPASINQKTVLRIQSFGIEPQLTALLIEGKNIFIDKDAFAGCPNLTSLSLDASLLSESGETNWSFYGASAIKSVRVTGGNIPGYAFKNADNVSVSLSGGVISENEGTVTITGGVTGIGDYAFYNCTGLSSIEIPSSVISIGPSAFLGCINLSSVSLPASLLFDNRSNNSWIFFGANGVDTVSVISDVSSKIKDYAFYNAKNIKNLTIGSNITQIGDYACANMTRLSSIVIPSKVELIGNFAFYNCSALTSLVFASGSVIKNIGNSAFAYCSNISQRELTLPQTLLSIGKSAFFNLINVQRVTISNAPCSIGSYAFAVESTSLKSKLYYISLGTSVNRIDSYAFKNLVALTTINLPTSLLSIGVYAFENCKVLSSINIPYSAREIGEGAFSGTSLSTIRVDSASLHYIADDNVLYNFNKSLLLTYATAKTASTFTVPGTVTRIANNAFFGATSLAAVSLSSGLKEIGNYTFAGCNGISNISLGNYFTKIGNNAFYGCSKLAYVQFGNYSIEFVGSNVFTGAHEDLLLYVPTNTLNDYLAVSGMAEYASILKEQSSWYGNFSISTVSGGVEINQFKGSEADIIIPRLLNQKLVVGISDSAFYNKLTLKKVSFAENSAVSYIGASAFEACVNLTDITFPKALSTLGAKAFYGCTSLANVFVETGNASFSVENNVLYNFDKSELILYPAGLTATAFTVPSFVNAIGGYAFSCAKINTVDFEANSGLQTVRPYAFENAINLSGFNASNTMLRTIGNSAFNGCVKLDSLSLPVSLISIGSYAFFGCTLLKETSFNGISFSSLSNLSVIGSYALSGTGFINAAFPASVRDIAPYLFYNTASLRTIVLGNSVTNIGEYSLANTSISEISLPNSVTFIGWNAFYNCNLLTSITIDKLNSELSQIGAFAFYNCSSLASINLPNNLDSVGSYAFYNNSSLTSLVIPDKLNAIAAYAFYGCSSLGSLSFGVNSSLQYIMEYAFAGGNNLETVSLPCSLTVIGESAFNGAQKLSEIVFNDGSSLNTIGSRAFYSNGLLLGILIPEGTASIGDEAFAECSSLVSVSVPVTVTSIGNDVFRGTAWFNNYYGNFIVVGDILYHYDGDEQNVIIPAGIKAIGDNAFYGKNSIVSVTLPSSVESIGNRAFNGCTSLESVTAEAGSLLKYIGSGAFYGANALHTFVLPEGLLTIGDNAFYGCTGLASFNLPSSVTSIGSYAFYDCTGLETFTVSDATLVISEYAFAFSSLGISNLTTFNLGANVTEISSFAFYNTDKLNSITIGNKITKIGESAFSNSALTRLIFASGSTLKTLGKNSFSGCTLLKGNMTDVLLLPASLLEIGAYAFYNCTGLLSVEIENAALSIGNYAFAYSLSVTPLLNKVLLGNAVTEIGDYAFYNAKQLAKIATSDLADKLPSTLNKIGRNAFYGCIALTVIALPDNMKNIGENAFGDTTLLTNLSVGAGALFSNNGNENWSFYGALNIKNVTVSASDILSSIPSYAFYNAAVLETVVLENNITDIGAYAFYGATHLGGFNYRDIAASSLNTIGAYAFASKNLLTSLEFPLSIDSIGEYAFYNCDQLASVIFNNSAANIGAYAFSVDDLTVSSLHYVDFGTSLLSIGNYAFKDCVNLYSDNSGVAYLTIPNTVTAIGESAFYNNSALVSLTLSGGVTFISDYAFAYSLNLASVTIPAEVLSIGEGVFRGCNALSVLNFEASSLIETIGAYAFCETSLVSISLPNGISSIGAYAFADISALTSIVFENELNPVNLTAIPEGFLFGASNLLEYRVPDSINSLGAYAFKNCIKLERILISETSTLVSVGEEAFYGCAKLVATTTYVMGNPDVFTLPEGVKTLGNKAFFNATSISNLVLPAGLVNVGQSVLEGMSGLTNLTLPILSGGYIENTHSYLRYYFGAKVYNSSNIIIPDTLNTVYVNNAVNGLSYAFYRPNKIQNVYFTDISALKEIGDRAFYNTDENRSLKNLYFVDGGTTLQNTTPDTLRRIGVSAFYNCRELSTLTLNNGLSEIGAEAFAFCHRFTSFTLPWSVTSIGIGILKQLNDNEGMLDTLTLHLNETYQINTASFVKYFFGASQPSISVFIPFRLTTVNLIGKYNTVPANAFYGLSGVNTINIPSNITSIGASAFENCSSLTSINFHKIIVPEAPEVPYEITLVNSLPENITSVGVSAFKNCAKLTSLALTESVTYIGKGILEGTTLLSALTTPFTYEASFLKYFYGALVYSDSVSVPAALKSVTIKGNFDESIGAFYNCGSLTSVDISETTQLLVLGENALSGCISLTSVSLPASLTSISASAFYNCHSLASVSLPSELETISESAFNGCSKLLSVTIPAKVKTIASNAFRDCALLTNCYFATTEINGKQVSMLTTLGDNVFYNCFALVELLLPKSVTNIGLNLLGKTSGSLSPLSIAKIAVPLSNGANSYVGYYFGGNDTLTQYRVFPSSLRTVIINEGVEVFPDNALNFNDSAYSYITTIVLPSTLSSVGGSTLFGNRRVENLTLPFKSTFNSLERYFGGNNNVPTTIQHIVLTDGSTSISNETGTEYGEFDFPSLKTIKIPYSVTSIPRGIFGSRNNQNFTEITIPLFGEYNPNAPTYLKYYFGAMNNSESVTINNALTTVNISEGTSYIDAGALNGSQYISHIGLPSSLVYADRIAFTGTLWYDYALNLASQPGSNEEDKFLVSNGILVRYFGNGVYELGNDNTVMIAQNIKSILTYAFYESGVKHIAFPAYGGASLITSIAYYAFSGASLLETVSFDTDIHLKLLGGLAFNDTASLREVHLPANIDVIAKGAFSGCNNLTEITVTFKDTYLENTASYLSYYFGGDSYLNNNSASALIPSSLVTVNIAEGVTKIPENALRLCSYVTSVNIPSSVLRIGLNAFKDTGWVTVTDGLISKQINAEGDKILLAYVGSDLSVTIPSDIVVISDDAFNSNTTINQILFATRTKPIEIGDRAFANMTALDRVHLPANAVCGRSVFEGSSALNQMTAPLYVTPLGNNRYAPALKQSSLAYYFGGSSYNDYGMVPATLSKFFLPQGSLAIPEYAFCNIASLETVDIPTSIEFIGNNAFSGCIQLKSGTGIGESMLLSSEHTALRVIEERAFYSAARLHELYIPSGVTYVGYAILSGANTVSKLYFRMENEFNENSLSYISYLFGSPYTSYSSVPSTLNSVHLLMGSTKVPDYAFYRLQYISSVTFEDNITDIGNFAFYSCSSLVSMFIPGAVNIGMSAFYACTALNDFDENNLTLVDFYAPNLVSLGKEAVIGTAWHKRSDIYNAENMLILNGNMLVSYNGTANIVIIPKEIVIIASFIFTNPLEQTYNSNVTSVSFEAASALTTVDDMAFYGLLNLTSIEFPAKEISFGNSVLGSCSKLETLSVPLLAKFKENTASYILYYFGSTTPEAENANTIQKIKYLTVNNIIPVNYVEQVIDNAGVITEVNRTAENVIPEKAFYNMRSLISVTVPNNITAIGKEAFYLNSSLLKLNSVENMISIGALVDTIGDSAFENASAIKEVSITSNTVNIGRNVFKGATSIEKLSAPLFEKGENKASFIAYYFGGITYEANSILPASLKTFIIADGTVTIADDAMNGAVNLTSVKMPLSVTKIGQRVLANTNNLVSLELVFIGASYQQNTPTYLPYFFGGMTYSAVSTISATLRNIIVVSGVTAIPNNAFYGASSLYSLVIPASVTSIGTNVLTGCTYLSSLTTPLDGAFSSIKYFFGGVTNNDYNMVEARLKTVIVQPQAGVTFVSDYAFFTLKNLTTVILPDTVTSIGARAFYDCINLINLTLPSSLVSVSDFAFGNCSALNTLIFPESASDISNTALNGCVGLENLTVNLNGKLLSTLFGASALTIDARQNQNYVPALLKNLKIYGVNIADYACNGLSTLATVEFLSQIESIGRYAFGGCSLLEITGGFPSSLNFVGDNAFSSSAWLNNSLDLVVAGDVLVKYKGNEAVLDLSASGITSIASLAFENNTTLTSVILPDGLVSIEDRAFYGCTNLSALSISAGNQNFAVLDNVLYKKEESTFSLALYPMGRTATSFTLPSNIGGLNVVAVSNYAFEGSALTLLTLTQVVTSVSDYAFVGADNLTEFALSEATGTYTATNGILFKGNELVCYPSNKSGTAYIFEPTITSIAAYAFRNARNLTTVNLSGNVTSVGIGAFFGAQLLSDITVVFTPVVNKLSYYFTAQESYIFEKTIAIPSSLTVVRVAEGIISIPESAFENCSLLTSIVLPASLTEIKSRAFADCASLTSIEIGYAVNLIGSQILVGCFALERVSVPLKNVASDNYFFKYYFGAGNPYSTVSIPAGLTEVSVATGVTGIAPYAFYALSNVNTINLPDTLTTIGEYAFYRASALQSITVPEGVTFIGDGAICDVSSLKSVVFPATLDTVGKNVLQNSSAIISLITPLVNNYKENGAVYSFAASERRYIKYLFGGKDYNFTSIPYGLDNITINNAETEILSFEFYGLDKINSIRLPLELVSVGERAFMNTALESLSFDGAAVNFTVVNDALYNNAKTILYAYATASLSVSYTIETTVTEIADGAFTGANIITSLNLSDSLITIGDFAFKNMSGLTSLVIPSNNLVSIGEGILSGANALTELTAPIISCASYLAYYFGGASSKENYMIPSSLVKFTVAEPSTAIGYEAFYGAQNLQEIVLPASVTSIAGGAFRACLSLSVFTLLGSSHFETDIDNVLYTIGKTAVIAYPIASASVSYTAPTSVTEIYDYAFNGAYKLKQVVLTENITTIGEGCFTSCILLEEMTLPLKDVYVPNTASYLKYYFGGDSYNSGTLPPNLKKLTVLGATKIPEFAFYFCTTLNEINLPAVTEIGSSAFFGASALTNFEIPASVNKFGANILKNADSLVSLTTPLLNEYKAATASYLAYLFGGNSYASYLSVPASLKTVTVNAIVSETGGEYARSIASYAFFGLNKITRVILPDVLTSIGSYAFYNAISLSQIENFNNNLNSVGEYAFANTAWLRTKSGLITLSAGKLLVAANTSNTNVVIPATVEKISNYAFFNNNAISTVSYAVGSVLSYIGDYAFANCSNLVSVSLPNTISYLGEGALSGDNRLHSFVIPVTTTELEIGKNLLYNSNGITSLTVALKSVYAPNTPSYLRYFFGGSRYDIGNVPASLISVRLSEGMTAIPEYAFYHCNTIRNINIPSTVTSIGENAFSYCFGLEAFEVLGSNYFKTDNNGVLLSYDGTVLYNYPAAASATSYSVAEGVTTVNNEAFYGADKLTHVALSSTVTTFGTNVFGKCLSLNRLTVASGNALFFAENGVLYKNEGANLSLVCYPAKLEDKIYDDMTGYKIKGGTHTINESAFAYSSVSCISFPDSVTVIEEKAFFGASNLTTIMFNKATSVLSDIGAFAFYACSSLTEAVLPDAVKTIGDSAFRHCSALKNVVLPLGLTFVGTCVLSNDTAIENVTLPLASPYMENNFSYLRYYFGGTSYLTGGEVPASLKNVEIASGITAIGNYAFFGLKNIENLILPESVISVGVNTLKNTNLISLTAPFAASYSADNNSYLAYYFGGSSPADYLTVPVTLKTINVIGTSAIGDNAFYKANYVTSVTLCDISSIGINAFSEMSSLAAISLPATLTSIGENAFYRTNSLFTLEVPTSVLFDNGGKATWSFYGATAVRNVSVTSGTTIPDNAFYNAGFGSLTLGKMTIVDEQPVLTSTITSIGNGAFRNFATLASLTIPNTVTSIGTDILTGAVALANLKTPFATGFEYIAYFFGAAGYEEFNKIPVALKTVEITKGNIADHAFYKASEIENVILNSETISIGENAFYASGLTAITLPASVNIIGMDAFMLTSDLLSFTVSEANIKYVSYNDVLFEKSGSEYILIAYPSSKIGAAYVIGKGATAESEILNVTTITKRAFYGNIKLTQITVPVSVLTIEEQAFVNVVNLTTINAEEGNVNYSSESGILYKKDGAKLIVWSYPTKRPAGSEGSTAKGYVVPATVSEIAPYAFYNASRLYNINFESATSLTKINDYAFYGVTSLIDVTLPSSLIYIGEYAFADMRGVITVNLPVAGSLEYIMDYAFMGMDRITSLIIPSTVKYVGAGILTGAVKIATLSVPLGEAGETVNVFGTNYLSAHSFVSYYFGGVNAETDSGLVPVSLTSLNLLAPLGAYMTLGNYSASNMINVKNLSISERVYSIESLAFAGLSSLETIAISNLSQISVLGTYKTVDGVLYGNLDVGGTSYYSLINYPLKKIATVLNLNSEVQYIAPNSFLGANYLTQIVFPIGSKLKRIGDYAFKNATALKSINIPASVETIGIGILEGTLALASMTVSLSSGSDELYTNLTSGYISYYFGGTGYLDNSLLPASLKTVNVVNTGKIIERAFAGCVSVQNVTLPKTLATVSSLGANIFENCTSLASLNLPFGTGYDSLAYYLGKQSYQNYYAEHYTEVAGLTATVVYNETLASGYTAAVTSTFPTTLLTVTVSAVYNDQISDFAFFGASAVSRINLPDTITAIGTAAFGGLSSITGIDIPSNVSAIGSYAFIGCTDLIEAVIPDTSVLTDIGDYAFYGCTTLFNTAYNFAFYIPSCLTGIGEGAFNGCGSMIVNFAGATVPVICAGAFDNCSLTVYVPTGALNNYNTALGAYTIVSITEV